MAYKTSINIETFVKEYIPYRYECPRRIQTDRGRLYISQIMKEFFQEYNIIHTVIAPYYSKSNGAVERVIGAIKSVMKKVRLGGTNAWKIALHIVVGAYRMFPNQATGFPPLKCCMGEKPFGLRKYHIFYMIVMKLI